MQGKKILLSTLLSNIGIFKLIKYFKSDNLVVFNYHRIYKSPLNTMFDEGVFAHSEDTFEKQIKWIKHNFNIIDEATLISMIENKKKINGRTAMITFDDGYLDNYELAYPILKALNVPATFFIPCNQIERTSSPWWDNISCMVKSTKKEFITIQGRTFQTHNEESKTDAIYKILKIFKITPDKETLVLLAKLHKSCCLDISLDQVSRMSLDEFMNWEQIKEISNNNITIGSHTMSHRILGNLPNTQQVEEIVNSKAFLENKLDVIISSIAYPVGGVSSFTNETKLFTKKAGYKLGYSFINGYSKNMITDNFQIPRVELSQSSTLYKAQSLLPKFF